MFKKYVARIASNAFAHNELTSVIFIGHGKNKIQLIEPNAFYDNKLTTITLVGNIDISTFSDLLTNMRESITTLNVDKIAAHYNGGTQALDRIISYKLKKSIVIRLVRII